MVQHMNSARFGHVYEQVVMACMGQKEQNAYGDPSGHEVGLVDEKHEVFVRVLRANVALEIGTARAVRVASIEHLHDHIRRVDHLHTTLIKTTMFSTLFINKVAIKLSASVGMSRCSYTSPANGKVAGKGNHRRSVCY